MRHETARAAGREWGAWWASRVRRMPHQTDLQLEVACDESVADVAAFANGWVDKPGEQTKQAKDFRQGFFQGYEARVVSWIGRTS